MHHHNRKHSAQSQTSGQARLHATHRVNRNSGIATGGRLAAARAPSALHSGDRPPTGRRAVAKARRSAAGNGGRKRTAYRRAARAAWPERGVGGARHCSRPRCPPVPLPPPPTVSQPREVESVGCVTSRPGECLRVAPNGDSRGLKIESGGPASLGKTTATSDRDCPWLPTDRDSSE